MTKGMKIIIITLLAVVVITAGIIIYFRDFSPQTCPGRGCTTGCTTITDSSVNKMLGGTYEMCP
jgi:hypothetical protein